MHSCIHTGDIRELSGALARLGLAHVAPLNPSSTGSGPSISLPAALTSPGHAQPQLLNPQLKVQTHGMQPTGVTAASAAGHGGAGTAPTGAGRTLRLCALNESLHEVQVARALASVPGTLEAWPQVMGAAFCLVAVPHMHVALRLHCGCV